MLFRRFTKFWIIWATLYFFENFDRKNNIVLTVEHIVAIFFFRKGQGIKVWLLLYPLRLSNPHSMQIWDRTNLSVLEPCLSSAASRSEPVQQCVGILFLPPDESMSVLMTISNEPILCILIVSIFNIFFHMVKVLEIIFKMSGRWTL